MAAAQTKRHEEDEHTGMQGKKRKKRKTKSRKQGTKASKNIVLKASPSQQIFPPLLQSRDGDLVTPFAIFLLSSVTASRVTAAAFSSCVTLSAKTTQYDGRRLYPAQIKEFPCYNEEVQMQEATLLRPRRVTQEYVVVELVGTLRCCGKLFERRGN